MTCNNRGTKKLVYHGTYFESSIRGGRGALAVATFAIRKQCQRRTPWRKGRITESNTETETTMRGEQEIAEVECQSKKTALWGRGLGRVMKDSVESLMEGKRVWWLGQRKENVFAGSWTHHNHKSPESSNEDSWTQADEKKKKESKNNKRRWGEEEDLLAQARMF